MNTEISAAYASVKQTFGSRIKLVDLYAQLARGQQWLCALAPHR